MEKQENDNNDGEECLAEQVGSESEEEDKSHPEELMIKKLWPRNQNSGYDKM